jgi:hypothetical protein
MNANVAKSIFEGATILRIEELEYTILDSLEITTGATSVKQQNYQEVILSWPQPSTLAALYETLFAQAHLRRAVGEVRRAVCGGAVMQNGVKYEHKNPWTFTES